MNVITFDYDRSYIKDAADKYQEDVRMFGVEGLNSDGGPKFADGLEWVSTSLYITLALLVCSLVAFLVIGRVPRQYPTTNEDGEASMPPLEKVEAAALSVLALSLAAFVVIGCLWIKFADNPDGIEKPDYKAALEKTIAENRDEFDEAVRLAADQAGIDIVEMCGSGQSRQPIQRGRGFSSRNNDNFVQCGGDYFGTIALVDGDGRYVSAIATSTGAQTGTVIAATELRGEDDAARLSSVVFDGSNTTVYAKDPRGEEGWSVDSGKRTRTERPFAPEDEMTLEEARQDRPE
jgi:hypothetical protein